MTGEENNPQDISKEKTQEKKNLIKKTQDKKPPQEKFPCGICNTLYSKGYLKIHIKTHERKDQEENKISATEEGGN